MINKLAQTLLVLLSLASRTQAQEVTPATGDPAVTSILKPLLNRHDVPAMSAAISAPEMSLRTTPVP